LLELKLNGTHQLLVYADNMNLLGESIDTIKKMKTKNFVALVRKRTIPTERPPLVGEVSANFLQVEGDASSAQRIPTTVFSVF
jgi:hypothetical protein